MWLLLVYRGLREICKKRADLDIIDAWNDQGKSGGGYLPEVGICEGMSCHSSTSPCTVVLSVKDATMLMLLSL